MCVQDLSPLVPGLRDGAGAWVRNLLRGDRFPVHQSARVIELCLPPPAGLLMWFLGPIHSCRVWGPVCSEHGSVQTCTVCFRSLEQDKDTEQATKFARGRKLTCTLQVTRESYIWCTLSRAEHSARLNALAVLPQISDLLQGLQEWQ